MRTDCLNWGDRLTEKGTDRYSIVEGDREGIATFLEREIESVRALKGSN